jgi:hypothetical protein
MESSNWTSPPTLAAAWTIHASGSPADRGGCSGWIGLVKILDDVATVIPRRAWLTELDWDPERVEVVGNAVAIDDVSEFMMAAVRAESFSDAKLVKATSAPPGDRSVVQFRLVLYPRR